MQKLYRKSEIWFAIIWIIVYVVGTGLADGLSEQIGVEKGITLPYLLILCAVALVWMRKNGLFQKYGLCATDIKAVRFLYYIPLLGIVSCNFWFGTAWDGAVLKTVLFMASMICVGFLEEIIFRGFLFKAMAKENLTAAVIVSSVTFGIGHIVNLFNGSGADLLTNLCQVCYAMAGGFLFVILFYRGKSLWPCIAAHAAVNALSVFEMPAKTAQMHIISAAILTFISLAYALILLKTLPKAEKE